jgi:diguanylate cyclase (GGDEF)-like protein
MADTVKLLDHVRQENRVMAQMADLATSSQEYHDLVDAVLDLIEQLVSGPFLGLSIQESERAGHYVRAGDDVDPRWAEEVGERVAALQERRLSQGMTGARSVVHRLSSPVAWLVSFAAQSRSGRFAVLTLGCPEPLTVEPEEERLMARLVRQALLVLDQALLLEQLEQQEVTDRLTGTINHRRLLETLDYEIERHSYHHRWLALLLLDIQGLDRINRSYGRQYGNHILQRVAQLIQESVRPIDVTARYRLDKFAVVLPETDEEEGREMAEALRERLLEVEFAGGAISVSAGVAHVKPGEILTADAFLLRAEQALHTAKRQERGWQTLLQTGTVKARR